MVRHATDRLSSADVLCLAGAGVLTGVSYLFLQSYLVWGCLVPLLYVLHGRQPRSALLCGAIYGSAAALFLFGWVIPVATRYSGAFTAYSLVLYGIAVVYSSIYAALFGLGYSFLRGRTENRILAGISIASLYAVLESVRMAVFPGSPWFHYTLALTQARQPWMVQWAGVGGLAMIVFCVVFFNYCVAEWLRKRDVVLLGTAAAVVAFCFGGGALLAGATEADDGPPYVVALLNDNIPAEMRWDDRTGDSLAAVLFRMNEEAARQDPDLIVWSETAIPWKLRSDDEFIPAVVSITRRSRADHLLGIWSPSAGDGRLVHNSAYLVARSGVIAGRYDKTLLLDFLERPFGGGTIPLLPFLNTSRYDNILPGASADLMTTGRARIGVLICNEGLSERMYASYARQGATLCVVMSNDAWFERTSMQAHHFYASALGAVMFGRDVVVNSNRGIAGIVRATGAVEAFPPSESGRVVMCEARLSSRVTIYSRIRDYTIPFYALLTCLSMVIGRK